MRFNDKCKVIIETLSESEARAFVLFLKSEITRHQMDIENARDLLYEVCFKFKTADILDS